MCSHRRTIPPDPNAIPESVHELRERLAEILHDLHSPLAALSLLALPEDSSNLPEDGPKRQLRRAVTALRRQTFVLRDHPLFRSAPIVLSSARVELRPWLDDLRVQLEELARARGIDLEWGPVPASGSFVFDAPRLSGAVEHLFMHRARRSTRPGRVRVSVRSDRDALEIAIAGQEASDPDPLAPRHRSPTGVEFAAAVVEAHDGELLEELLLDGFVEWRLRVACSSYFDSAFDADSSAHDGALRRVLVIEDDQALRELLVDLLSIRFQVDSSRDASEALQCAIDNPPDLIVADQGLPDAVGTDLAQTIRERTGVEIPLLLVTGCGPDVGIPKLSRMGVLVKPFRGTDLLSRSSDLLRSSDEQDMP